MVRQRHLIAVVGTFLIGCAFLLLVVGCAGSQSQAPPKKEDQGHIEATKEAHEHTEATVSEEARCEGTRTTKNPILHSEAAANDRFRYKGSLITNDLRDCPNGGLLLGTDKRDKLGGLEGDDEIRGLGAADQIFGGVGKDVIYGGPGDDSPW